MVRKSSTVIFALRGSGVDSACLAGNGGSKEKKTAEQQQAHANQIHAMRPPLVNGPHTEPHETLDDGRRRKSRSCRVLECGSLPVLSEVEGLPLFLHLTKHESRLEIALPATAATRKAAASRCTPKCIGRIPD